MHYLTANQFIDWLAYCEITGLMGQDRNDIFHAFRIAQEDNKYRSKGEIPSKPIEFMFYTEKPEQTEEEIIDKIKGLFG